MRGGVSVWKSKINGKPLTDSREERLDYIVEVALLYGRKT
jgi:hypothetical protein